MKIENQQLFLEKLRTGISFFTGAGFSTLPNDKGEILPMAAGLAEELVKKFEIDEIFKDDLSYITEQIPPIELDEFLREKYTVKSYNPLYKCINKIKMHAYVTTNIDNIIRKVVDDGDVYYLNNIREYGAPTYNPNELVYIPLHGDVINKNDTLYFSKFEMTQVTTKNKDLFDSMYIYLCKKPILFIGYSFNDSGVLQVINELLDKGAHDIWVQCLTSDKKNITLFKKKGCNIIEGTTEELLAWINSQDIATDTVSSCNLKDSSLKHYLIPNMSKVTSVPNSEYYQMGDTQWYHILADVPYERSAINAIYNDALIIKHIIIVGEHFSGKTTMLMQLAIKVTETNKIYMDTPTLEEAKFICKKLKDQKLWIFIKNCTGDIEALKLLAQQPHFYIIGTSHDYQFETIKHLIDGCFVYKTTNISELSKNDAQGIFNKIPNSLKQKNFKYKENGQSYDKYSMLEFIGLNVSISFPKTKIRTIFNQTLRNNKKLFEILALTSYLSENYSAISYEIIARYFNINVYPEAFNLVNETKEYLTRHQYEEMDTFSDYYVLRSKLFSQYARSLLLNEFKHEYALIIEKFIKNIPLYVIVKYHIFSRKAYDSNLFYSLFAYDKAIDLYTLLYNSSSNCYILQQSALCKMRFRHYKEAFVDIDKALNIAPNNFSIQNSQAIILFEANKQEKTEEALKFLKNAMDILKQCYLNDKRKVYHAQKFSEFAIFLNDEYECNDYIEDAEKWLLEIINNPEENISRKTLELADKIRTIKNQF